MYAIIHVGYKRFIFLPFQLFIQGLKFNTDADNVKYVHVIFMNHLGAVFTIDTKIDGYIYLVN